MNQGLGKLLCMIPLDDTYIQTSDQECMVNQN